MNMGRVGEAEALVLRRHKLCADVELHEPDDRHEGMGWFFVRERK